MKKIVMKGKIMTIGKMDDQNEILNNVATCCDNSLMIIEDLQHIDVGKTISVEAFIVVLCLKGKGSLFINNRSYDIREHDMLFCHPNVILEHGMVSIDCSFCGFLLSPEYVKHIFMLFPDSWNSKLYIEQNPIITLNEDEVHLFCQYFDLLRSKLTGSTRKHQKELIESLAQAFAYEFYDALERILQTNPISYSSGENLFRSFMELISASYPKQRMVSFYADKLNVTPKYLSAVCKEMSGHTASDIINQYVVKDVEALLKRSGRSIKEVANELMFPNLSFFGKYVKKHLGVSPKQYREKLLVEKEQD